MAVEKNTLGRMILALRTMIPGLKDKIAGAYLHFRENPKEFLTQKPVAWTLGTIGLVLGTLLLIGLYQWLAEYQAGQFKGTKDYAVASREASLQVISDSTGKLFTLRGEGLSGDGPFLDPATGKKDAWRALLSSDGQYYSAKPGPDGKPAEPPPLPTATPLPTPKPVKPPVKEEG